MITEKPRYSSNYFISDTIESAVCFIVPVDSTQVFYDYFSIIGR